MKDIFNHPWTIKFEKILQIPMGDLVEGYQRREIGLANSPNTSPGNYGISVYDTGSFGANYAKDGPLLDPSMYASTRATPEQKANRFSTYQDPGQSNAAGSNPKEVSTLDSIFGFFGCLNKD